MKWKLTQIAIPVFGLGLITFFIVNMCTFIVPYSETAFLTTFGKADTSRMLNTTGERAGLYVKAPWPIQKVIRYDRRLRSLDDRLEQQETKDRQVVIVRAHALWRITNPLAFYRTFGVEGQAALFLRERMRTAKAELGKFTFEELTNADSDRLRIQEANASLENRVRQEVNETQCGIAIESVAITRMILPEKITRSVFTRMKQTRQRLAQNARSEGTAVARSIRAKTESDRKRILAFAQRVADKIRAEGDAAAARYYRQYAQNQDFAVFLRKVETLKKTFGKNTTYILDTETPPLDLLNERN